MKKQERIKRVWERMSLLELVEMYANHKNDEIPLMANGAWNEIVERAKKLGEEVAK